MNYPKKVTVLCTAFNHEKLIRSALDGFIMQKTTFPVEFIVHDDASTDGTAAVIREYAQKYPDRIIPIYQTENQYSKGVPIVETFMLPISQGEYLAFCEGDDYWTDPMKLQKQVDFLDAHPEYIACVHNSVMHDCTGKLPDALVVDSDQEHDLEFEDAIKGMQYAYQLSALVHRRIHQPAPEFCQVAMGYGFGDWPGAIRLTLLGKVRFFAEPMSTYRLMSSPTAWSADNKSVQRRIYTLDGNIAMLRAVKKEVSEEKAALVDAQILKREFLKLELQENYRQMKKAPFEALWAQVSKKEKAKYLVKQYLPFLYHWIQRRRG